MSADAIAAFAALHDEAHELLTRIAAKVDSVMPDQADWGDVGDLRSIVERLREAAE